MCQSEILVFCKQRRRLDAGDKQYALGVSGHTSCNKPDAQPLTNGKQFCFFSGFKSCVVAVVHHVVSAAVCRNAALPAPTRWAGLHDDIWRFPGIYFVHSRPHCILETYRLIFNKSFTSPNRPTSSKKNQENCFLYLRSRLLETLKPCFLGEDFKPSCCLKVCRSLLLWRGGTILFGIATSSSLLPSLSKVDPMPGKVSLPRKFGDMTSDDKCCCSLPSPIIEWKEKLLQ